MRPTSSTSPAETTLYTTTTAKMKAISAYTPEELGALSMTPTIKIQWRLNKRHRLETLYEKFPKAVAMAFSPVINTHFTNDEPAAIK